MKNFYFACMMFILVGCASMHSGEIGIKSQEARAYQENGQYEDAIAVYRQLIANDPKHFNSVLYQHEIMTLTENLNDPTRLTNEIKQTVTMLQEAQNDYLKGSTLDDIQKEQDALNQFIYNKMIMRYKSFADAQPFTNERQRDQHLSDIDFMNDLYNILTDSQNEWNWNDKSCDEYYDLGNIAYLTKHDKDASFFYLKVLDTCDNNTLTQYPQSYVNAAHGYVLASQELMNDPSCPKSPKLTENKLDVSYPKYPIPVCRMQFIEATNRYLSAIQNYPDRDDELVYDAVFQSGKIYFEFNRFEEAIPLFETVIEHRPHSETAIYAVNYIVESYKAMQQDQTMLNYIQEIRNNSAFMSNQGPLMTELIAILGMYEEALIEKLNSK